MKKKYQVELMRVSVVEIEADKPSEVYQKVKEAIDDAGACNNPLFYKIDEDATDWLIRDVTLLSEK